MFLKAILLGTVLSLAPLGAIASAVTNEDVWKLIDKGHEFRDQYPIEKFEMPVKITTVNINKEQISQIRKSISMINSSKFSFAKKVGETNVLIMSVDNSKKTRLDQLKYLRKNDFPKWIIFLYRNSINEYSRVPCYDRYFMIKKSIKAYLVLVFRSQSINPYTCIRRMLFTSVGVARYALHDPTKHNLTEILSAREAFLLRCINKIPLKPGDGRNTVQRKVELSDWSQKCIR